MGEQQQKLGCERSEEVTFAAKEGIAGLEEFPQLAKRVGKVINLISGLSKGVIIAVSNELQGTNQFSGQCNYERVPVLLGCAINWLDYNV